jgi:hypothetical protein
MMRPAIRDLARKVTTLRHRRGLEIGLLGLLALIVGFVGQGSWGVGVATPTSVGAIVTDVIGGAGSRDPVRVKISLAVTNLGLDPVRVLQPDSTGSGTGSGTGTRLLGLTPADLLVDPGAIGRIEADVTLDCRLPEPLQLPDLQLELHDGTRRGLPVSAGEMPLEACSRAAAAVRPLAAAIDSPPSGDQLAVRLSSPTGRRTDVRAIRAGGAVLAMSAPTVTVAGKEPTVVRLTAPRTCPPQWQLAGVPSALTADLTTPSGPASTPEPGAPNPAGATVRLNLGPALTSWLLATSCVASP